MSAGVLVFSATDKALSWQEFFPVMTGHGSHGLYQSAGVSSIRQELLSQ